MTVPVHADQMQHGINPLVYEVGIDTAAFHRKREFILHAGAEQLGFRILLDVSDRAGELCDSAFGGVVSGDGHSTAHHPVFRVGDDAGERHAQRGFACPRRADDAGEGSGLDGEIQAVQRLDRFTGIGLRRVPPAEMVRRDDGGVAHMGTVIQWPAPAGVSGLAVAVSSETPVCWLEAAASSSGIVTVGCTPRLPMRTSGG